MSESNYGVTAYFFIRPTTPSSARAAAYTQIVEMYESGLIGPGSTVWCNLDVPNGMWVLSDVSQFVRIIDVPTAGWVRITRSGVVWGRLALDTTKNPSHGFNISDMPMPRREYDTVTVAFRNADSTPLRAQFAGGHHPLIDGSIEHHGIRVVDLKTTGALKLPELGPADEFDRDHAGIRGLDLLACSTGPHMHRVIRKHRSAFKVVIDPSDFSRVKSLNSRIAKLAEEVTDPVVQQISQIAEIGSFDGHDEMDESDPMPSLSSAME